MTTNDNNSCFLGIDVGTQGARVVLLDEKGNLLASKEDNFGLTEQAREEQDPGQWWKSCKTSLKQMLLDLKPQIDLNWIKAVSVTSTSGTIVPLDEQNEPLHPALMYSDGRSEKEATVCTAAARKAGIGGYNTFNASSGLAKMVWFVNQFPEKAGQLARFVHAADFIIGKLCNNFSVTDFTNALKSGYDVHNNRWPDYIWNDLPLQKHWLPAVVPSGNIIASVDPALAIELGLGNQVRVVAGMTDGCASQIASGAVSPGDWNTTIGTTLVLKGVTTNYIDDPGGRLYNHRHPEGFWMPGGAANIGADWISHLFGKDFRTLDREAELLIPTTNLAYPLMQKGERFPFVAPQAEGFFPDGLSRPELFAACMEGTAYVERYAYELVQKLSGENVKTVFSAGGGSNSHTWLTIRASVLNRPVVKMKHVTGAVGAAILAASQTHFSSLSHAARSLTQKEKTVTPDPAFVKSYDEGYNNFIHTLENKGYLPKHQYA